MKQHLTQKLHKTSLIFKNPKVNQKSQKLGQKHEMHDGMSEKDHTRCKKMIFRPKISWEWSQIEKSVFGKWKGWNQLREIKESRSKITKHIYIEIS